MSKLHTPAASFEISQDNERRIKALMRLAKINRPQAVKFSLYVGLSFLRMATGQFKRVPKIMRHIGADIHL